MMFVAYHVDGWDEDKVVPVSTGSTKHEALSLAITRMLSMGVTDGAIGVRKVESLSPEQFAKLTVFLNNWFGERITLQ